jgi:uncharacterized damage-inducible protein DinB
MPLQVGQHGRILAVRTERFVDDGVQDPVAGDRRRTGVRQQRIRDAVPLREVSQDLPGVVADRRQADAALPELAGATLQLDELRAAERSPVRRADEHQHRPAASHDRLQRPFTSGLVAQPEIRNALADLRSELRDIDSRPRSLRLEESRRQEGDHRQQQTASHLASHAITLRFLGARCERRDGTPRDPPARAFQIESGPEATMDLQELQTLLDYHYWARDRMLDALEALTPEQFTRNLGNSFPSIRDTVAHLYGADWIWCSRWDGESPDALPDAKQFADVAAIRAAWTRQEEKVRAALRRFGGQGLDRPVEYRRSGQAQAQPFWQTLQHVVNHGSYHRGQVTTMLRQLGVPPPKSMDLVTFYRERANMPT